MPRAQELDLSPDLNLPDLAFVDDDGLEVLFPSVDGRWSAQTRAILAAFGVEKLDLNANWASAPRDWSCPVCQRYKPQIARLSPAGVLICHLERHHDHLRDEGMRRLWKGLPVQPDAASARAQSSAASACQGLTERFFTTLVCKDCNAAEGKAKAVLRGVIHPEFSFSPSEIRRFIVVTPNQPHEIVEAVARTIWAEVAEDVADRLAFISVLAKRIAEGRHRREGSPYERPLTLALLSDVLLGQGSAYSPEGLLAELAARSIQSDGFGTSLNARPRTRVVYPTQADLDAVAATKKAHDLWHAPTTDWRCEVCNRNRFEILRQSTKSGLWTANIHRRRIFTAETRPEALQWRYGWYGGGLSFGSHWFTYVCQDCRLALTDIRRSGQDLLDDCLSPSALKGLLNEVQPHIRPGYDRAAAARLAADNVEYAAAVADYDTHRQRCVNLFHNRRAWLRVTTAAEVRDRQLGEIWDEHLTEEERPHMLDWLLTEGEAYAAANARDRWPPEG